MSKMPCISYFLGANTADGFYSVYDDLVKDERIEKIYYLKGGPGSGKSTLMRRVAEAAETKGYQVEYILCSGDPNSLDGVLIPNAKAALVDATSPHVQEPPLPGVSGRYLDLSQFYKKGARYDKEAIAALFREYRAQYTRAYRLMGAAKAVDPLEIPGVLTEHERLHLEESGRQTVRELLPDSKSHSCIRRFISAYTCLGLVSLTGSIWANGRAILLQSRKDTAFCWLSGAEKACRELGQKVILCPDPLEPDKLDALILPEVGISFLTARRGIQYPAGRRKTIVLDDLTAEVQITGYKEAVRTRRSLMRQATDCLIRAKELHDALEALYADTVDFKAVDRFTERTIKEVLLS